MIFSKTRPRAIPDLDQVPGLIAKPVFGPKGEIQERGILVLNTARTTSPLMADLRRFRYLCWVVAVDLQMMVPSDIARYWENFADMVISYRDDIAEDEWTGDFPLVIRPDWAPSQHVDRTLFKPGCPRAGRSWDLMVSAEIRWDKSWNRIYAYLEQIEGLKVLVHAPLAERYNQGEDDLAQERIKNLCQQKGFEFSGTKAPHRYFAALVNQSRSLLFASLHDPDPRIVFEALASHTTVLVDEEALFLTKYLMPSTGWAHVTPGSLRIPEDPEFEGWGGPSAETATEALCGLVKKHLGDHSSRIVSLTSPAVYETLVERENKAQLLIRIEEASEAPALAHQHEGERGFDGDLNVFWVTWGREYFQLAAASAIQALHAYQGYEEYQIKPKVIAMNYEWLPRKLIERVRARGVEVILDDDDRWAIKGNIDRFRFNWIQRIGGPCLYVDSDCFIVKPIPKLTFRRGMLQNFNFSPLGVGETGSFKSYQIQAICKHLGQKYNGIYLPVAVGPRWRELFFDTIGNLAEHWEIFRWGTLNTGFMFWGGSGPFSFAEELDRLHDELNEATQGGGTLLGEVILTYLSTHGKAPEQVFEFHPGINRLCASDDSLWHEYFKFQKYGDDWFIEPKNDDYTAHVGRYIRVSPFSLQFNMQGNVEPYFSTNVDRELFEFSGG